MMNQQEINITYDGGTITVKWVDNDVTISVNSSSLNQIEIVAEHAGSPGIIGPNITFNLESLVNKAIEEQRIKAQKGI